jgi:membrane protease subunit (stomatin/prohibitin family)
MKVKTLIAQAIIQNKVSALEISASLETISDYCAGEISGEFGRFGLKVVNFFIQSINFPDEDFEEINRILGQRASFDIIGDQRYVTKRSFDAIDLAAANEGGAAGTFTGAGVGLGLGVSLGGAMGGLTSNIATGAPGAPAAGQKACPSCGTANLEAAVFCCSCGKRLTPENVKCPDCGFENLAGSKFCISCGKNLVQTRKCGKCGEENEPNAKFCRNCGTNLEE